MIGYALVEALTPGDRVSTLAELVDVLTTRGRPSGPGDHPSPALAINRSTDSGTT